VTSLRGILGGVIGLAVAVSVAVAIEAILIFVLEELFERQFRPRGLGWISIPIIAGVGGFGLGKQIAVDASSASYVISSLDRFALWLRTLITGTRNRRIFVVSTVTWSSICIVARLVLDPRGYNWDRDDVNMFYLVWFAPVVCAIVLRFAIPWIQKAPRGPSN
jgi:MFS family permease